MAWQQRINGCSELEGTEMNTKAAERAADKDGRSLEVQIRGFVLKDNMPDHATVAGESAVNGVCSLVQRLAGTSLDGIANMIVQPPILRPWGQGKRF
jgi:hypothetical protein